MDEAANTAAASTGTTPGRKSDTDRLHELGYAQVFVPLHVDPRGPVATREYFPRRLRASISQRTRWVTGIALQGWLHHGWPRRQAFWFWRDRKGLLGNPASLLANLIFLYGTGTWIFGLAMESPWGLAGQSSVLAPTAVLGVALALSRAACSASIYGWKFAALSPLRSFLGNWLNSVASLGRSKAPSSRSTPS
jgi:adsorption protein B